MELTYETLKKIGNPSLYLCNPNQTELQTITPETANVTLRLNDISELSLTVNKYISSNNTHERIEQPCYKLIESKRLIKVDYIGWFEIVNVSETENENGSIKTITAHSHQSVYRNKGFYVEDRVYKFYNSEDPYDENYNASDVNAVPSVCGQLYKQLGIKFDLNETETYPTEDCKDWTLIYIDENLRFNESNIYRTLKSETTTGYDFMVNTVEKAFEGIWLFDLLTHTIKFKYISSITEPTDIYLSYDNLIQSIEVTENADNIVTVLNCNGGNDLNISTVNPMGTNYVVNFDYYKNTQWMSQELIDVLDQWKANYDSCVEEFTNLVKQLQSSYKTITELDNKITYEELKIKDLSDGRDLYITETPTKLEAFAIGKNSSYDSSPFKTSVFTGDETFTCYAKAFKYENNKFIPQGASSSGALRTCYSNGYKYFIDTNETTYCKLVYDESNILNIERYGIYDENIINICNLTESSEAIIACENVSIDENCLSTYSRYYANGFRKNSNDIFTCYKKPYMLNQQNNEGIDCIYGTLDECGRYGYVYFNDLEIYEGYTVAEYMETQPLGNSYINTNYFVNPKTKVFCEFQFSDKPTNNAYVFGSIDTSTNCFGFYRCSGDVWAYQFGDGTNHNIWTEMKTDTNRHCIVLDAANRQFIMDDIINTTIGYSITTTSSMPLYLFTRSSSSDGEYAKRCKIYSFMIYEDDNIVMQLVPCYKKGEGRLYEGYYDIISKQFHPNMSGLGVFSVGKSPLENNYCKINMSAEVKESITEATYYASGFTRFTTLDNASLWINKHEQYNNKLNQDKQKEQSKIDSTLLQMNNISEMCNIQKYIKSQDQTGELYREFESYWIEGDYTNDSYALTDDMTLVKSIDLSLQLKEAGEQQLKRVAQPKFTFNISSLDFLKIKDFQMFADQLELGKTVIVEKSQGLLYQPAVTEIAFNLFNSDEFTMTFSNSAKLNNNEFTFADLIAESSSVSKSVSSSWQDLMSYTKEKENINSIIADPLNRALRAGMGGAINQEFIIDNTGVLGRKYSDNDHTSFLDEQIRIINNTILFTNDNWNSVKTALGKIYYTDGGNEKTAYGLIAETIIGNLIMGNTLKIKNDDSTIFLDKDGISIKDKHANTLFNADIYGNVSITGQINALAGYIGTQENGFYINSDSISRSIFNSDGTLITNGDTSTRVLVSAGSVDNFEVYNSDNRSGWMLIAGNSFGVTNSGELYASYGSIAGLQLKREQGDNYVSSGLYGERFRLETRKGSGENDNYVLLAFYDENDASEPTSYMDSLNLVVPNVKVDDVTSTTGTITTLTTESIYSTQINISDALFISNKSILYYEGDNFKCGFYFATSNTSGNHKPCELRLSHWGGGSMFSTIQYRISIHDANTGSVTTLPNAYTCTIWYKKSDSNVEAKTITIPKDSEAYIFDVCSLGMFNTFDYCSFTQTKGTTSKRVSFGEASSGYNNITNFGSIIPNSNASFSLGNASKAWTGVYATTLYSSDGGVAILSDRNKKNSIEIISNKYDALFDSLQPVVFKYNNSSNGKVHIGLIAQDVQRNIMNAGLILEECALCHEEYDEKGNAYLSLVYNELISLNVYEIQKLKKRVADLESKLQKYEIKEG